MSKKQKIPKMNMKQYDFVVHLWDDTTGRMRQDLDGFSKRELERIKEGLSSEIERIDKEIKNLEK